MRRALLLATAAATVTAHSVTFRNEMDEDATVYWIDPDTKAKTKVGISKAYGGELRQITRVGHRFHATGEHGAYKAGAEDIVIREDRTAYSLTKNGRCRVECVVMGGKYGKHGRGKIGFTVYPDWSPRGAGRFLELVRKHFFDGCAINRVVPEFLAQFGIAEDYEARSWWRARTIPDDPSQKIPFKPGYVAFAGSGPNSRSTEMFVAMPGTSQHQLSAFGNNVWETPFAVADDDAVEHVLPMFLNPYGDMGPWGKGPDPQKIYKKDGYDYLHREFPLLARFESCRVKERPMPQVARRDL